MGVLIVQRFSCGLCFTVDIIVDQSAAEKVRDQLSVGNIMFKLFDCFISVELCVFKDFF